MSPTTLDSKWVEQWKLDKPHKARRICQTLRFYSKNSEPIILDVGCYEGSMEEQFGTYTKNLSIGFDKSFRAIKKALENAKKKKLHNVEFVVATADAIPIKDEKIDWIVCNYVIDYLDTKEKVIDEFERMLKKNGLIYLSVENSTFLNFYKKFPKLFKPIIKDHYFYGRVFPSIDSPFGTPENYRFWKKQLEGRKIRIQDITPELIFKNDSLYSETSSSSNLRQKLIKLIYPLLTQFSPTWAFLIYRK